VESLFRLFGVDCYLTSCATQRGANLIRENERFAVFDDSLRQLPHIVPIECFDHSLTYRLLRCLFLRKPPRYTKIAKAPSKPLEFPLDGRCQVLPCSDFGTSMSVG
jgi:hypothetical protein